MKKLIFMIIVFCSSMALKAQTTAPTLDETWSYLKKYMGDLEPTDRCNGYTNHDYGIYFNRTDATITTWHEGNCKERNEFWHWTAYLKNLDINNMVWSIKDVGTTETTSVVLRLKIYAKEGLIASVTNDKKSDDYYSFMFDNGKINTVADFKYKFQNALIHLINLCNQQAQKDPFSRN
ncbi:MAG: hypothetical protein QM610_08070 [Chitinophagaceae bacterium]